MFKHEDINMPWFTILLVCVNMHDVMNAVTYVKREAGVGKHDIFGLIPSLDKCDGVKYAGATSTGKHNECKCPFDKSTFLYSKMTCVSNSDIQQKLWTDCPTSRLLYFSGQYANFPYIVFDLNKASSKQNVDFHNVDKIKGEHCNASQIHYIDDSNGKLITPKVGNDIFTIDKHNKRLDWKTGSASIIFNGKVFRLKTQNCTFNLGVNPVVTNPCIVFKVQGTLNFSTSTSSIIHPTGTSSSSTRSVTVSITTHTSLVLPVPSQLIPGASSSVSSLSGSPTPANPGSSSVAYISTNTPRLTSVVLDTSIPVLSGTPSPTLVVPGISSSIPIGPSKPTDTKKDKDKRSSSTGAIVGSVMAIIAVAVFVVLLVIWRKRRQKSRQNDKVAKEPKDSSKSEVINLSKQQRQGPKITSREQLDSSDNDEYDYAVVDGDPRSHGNISSNGTAPQIYQSLDRTRVSVYSPLNREHDVPPEQQYTYNKVERPLYNPPRKGTPDPLYNVLNRPDDNGEDYHEPGGVQIKKPSYNKKPNSKQAPQNNEPLYNNIDQEVGVKKAHQENEPEHNVIEDPDGDYDNAPVETDMRHPSSHDNVGYASTIDNKSKQKPGTQRDPMYSVFEGPEGSLSEGTYQPLQEKAPGESMYQPLDRTSRIDNQPL